MVGRDTDVKACSKGERTLRTSRILLSPKERTKKGPPHLKKTTFPREGKGGASPDEYCIEKLEPPELVESDFYDKKYCSPRRESACL